MVLACIFVFVSARKPPVAENPQCTLPIKPQPQIAPTFLPPQQTTPNFLSQQKTTDHSPLPSNLHTDANKTISENSSESVPIKKKISYTIDYIVEGLPKVQEPVLSLYNNSHLKQSFQSPSIEENANFSNKNPPLNPTEEKKNVLNNHSNLYSQSPNAEEKNFFLHNKNMENLRKIALSDDSNIEVFNGCERNIVAEKEQAGNNNYYGSVCRYPDVTSEVKHARTPLNTINQETHSPQLPIPSPNYPVQTQLPIETAANAQLPNTIVPTLNNNYITAPHSASQSESKENAPSADCLLPHSNKLKNNVNNELKSDLKQKGHLSNLDVSECKNNHLNSNLKRVNQQCNVLKIQCEISNESKALKKSTETENSFTVLNIPNLSFQTPPAKRPKLSKIDLATIKRKMRRKKRLLRSINGTKENSERAKSQERKNKTLDCGVQVYGYSDSSNSSIYSSSEYESDLSEVDLWIRSGPPSKLDLGHEKVEFLKLFGLTTHNEKNCKLCTCFIQLKLHYLFIRRF